MSGGWSPKEVGLVNPSIGASVSAQVCSKEFAITNGGATWGLQIKVKLSAATVATGITFTLQDAIGDDWRTVKVNAGTVASGAGVYYIKLYVNGSGDAALLPLLAKGRIVVTTGAGDSCTIESIDVIQEL